MNNKWLMLIDPASFAILLCPIIVIYYGCFRSYKFNLEHHLMIVDNNDVPSSWLLMFPLLGSVSLLLFFYYLDNMYSFLIFVVFITSIFSVTFVSYPIVQYFLPKFKIHDTSKKVKILDEDVTITLSVVIGFFISSMLTLFWYYSNHYMFVNILSICSGITAISFMRLNNLKGLTLLLWIFLIYDVFWVFYSSFFFGESVMEKVAIKVLDKFYLPMLITFPKFFGNGFSSLGNGDFVLPGIFMCQLYFLDKYYNFDTSNSNNDYQSLPQTIRSNNINNSINNNSNNNNNSNIINSSNNNKIKFWFKNLGYFKISILGYASGLLISLFVVLITESGQPALLYLVPTVTLPVLITAIKRGQLSIILKSIPKPKQDLDSNNNNNHHHHNNNNNNNLTQNINVNYD